MYETYHPAFHLSAHLSSYSFRSLFGILIEKLILVLGILRKTCIKKNKTMKNHV